MRRTAVFGPALLLAGAASAQVPSFAPTPPCGLPPAIPAPADNPFDAARFALGQQLFFDTRLSVDGTIACASCHLPEHGFAHPDARPPGAQGRRARRHAPTLFNRAFGKAQFWDGRARTLEEQVLMPIGDPDEMATTPGEVVAKLAAVDTYRDAFNSVFGDGVSERNLAGALATFVRGLTFGDSPADRFLAGGRSELTRDERAGMWLYESKAGCWRCHPRPLFTDEGFHDTGIGARDGTPEAGRFAVTGDPADRGKFKTPTLRALTLTAPYMHDGSLATLRDVVEFYRRGGNANANLSPFLHPLDLEDQEVDFLVAFLRVLSVRGERPAAGDPGR